MKQCNFLIWGFLVTFFIFWFNYLSIDSQHLSINSTTYIPFINDSADLHSYCQEYQIETNCSIIQAGFLRYKYLKFSRIMFPVSDVSFGLHARLFLWNFEIILSSSLISGIQSINSEAVGATQCSVRIRIMSL